MLRSLTFFVACSIASACARSSQPQTPEQTVEAAIDALESNDLAGYLKLQLPPAMWSEWQSEWDKTRSQPITPDADKRFKTTMVELTAPDAEQKLLAKLLPQLRQAEGQMGMLSEVLQQAAQQRIESSIDLDEEQAALLADAQEGFSNWLERTKISDQARWKQSIAALCSTARKLDLGSLQALRSLEFEPMLGKGGAALAGVKQILEPWNLDVDGFLDTCSARTIATKGDSATVSLDCQLFGKPRSFEFEMVKLDGRWYSKRLIDQQAERTMQAGL